MSSPSLSIESLLGEGPVRAFTQARAKKTFEALIAAARKMFDERGFDATQTPDIAAEAGVSVGTFYRYFGDKKAIYLEVSRRHLVDAHREVMDGLTAERFSGTGQREAVEQIFALLVDHVTRYPGMHRSFVEMEMRDPDIAALKRVFDDAARGQLATFLAAVFPRTRLEDPEAAAYILHAAVVECALHLAGVRGGATIGRERGIAAMTDLVFRGLFGLEPTVP